MTSRSRSGPWVARSQRTIARQIVSPNRSFLSSNRSYDAWTTCTLLFHIYLPSITHFWSVTFVKPVTLCNWPPLHSKRWSLISKKRCCAMKKSSTKVTQHGPPPASNSFESTLTVKKQQFKSTRSSWLIFMRTFRLTCLLKNTSTHSFGQTFDTYRGTRHCPKVRKLTKMSSSMVKSYYLIQPAKIFAPQLSRLLWLHSAFLRLK